MTLLSNKDKALPIPRKASLTVMARTAATALPRVAWAASLAASSAG